MVVCNGFDCYCGWCFDLGDEMKKAVVNGALTFAAAVTCGAVAYAARDNGSAVVGLVWVVSVIFGLMAAAAND